MKKTIYLFLALSFICCKEESLNSPVSGSYDTYNISSLYPGRHCLVLRNDYTYFMWGDSVFWGSKMKYDSYFIEGTYSVKFANNNSGLITFSTDNTQKGFIKWQPIYAKYTFTNNEFVINDEFEGETHWNILRRN